MPNDQLSWEQILSGAAAATPAAAPTANPAEPSAETSSQSPAAANVSATSSEVSSAEGSIAGSDASSPRAKTSRSKKKTVKEPSADKDVLYAKKNWSKLELDKTSTTVELTPAVQPGAEATEFKATIAEQPAVSAKIDVTTTRVTVTTTEAKVAVTPTPDSRCMAPKSGAIDLFGDEPSEDVDLDEGKGKKEPQVLSVSELNRNIREILEGRFPLIWLKGEISNFKAHTSGHFYFSLKDSKAQISAVMFRGFNSQLRFRPEDGMEVLVRGKITVYEPRGNYQLFCELMEPVGAGALQKAFEQLKAKLQREGLFDPAKKRPLPSLPKHIAIVTSPTGAAIRDMLNVLGRRFKGVDITVIPCKVQGDQAPREIVAAIHLAQKLQDVDVMIVGRGGGSIEDLWAFNDEAVARAIAGCRVPVISAVGHEIDFTIADFVADLRAPTPSAAAELVVKNAADLGDRVLQLSKNLKLSLLRLLNSARQSTTSLSKRLIDPQRRIQDASIRCDELRQRLDGAILRSFETRRMEMALIGRRLGTPIPRIELERETVAGLEARLKSGVQGRLERKREALTRNMALLDSLSPLKVLDRGYSMVVRGSEIVTDATTLEVGSQVTVRMCKGSIEAKVTKIEDKR